MKEKKNSQSNSNNSYVTDKKRRMQYECQQALVRYHFKKPSAEKEWIKFHSSIRQTSLNKKSLLYKLTVPISAAIVVFGWLIYDLNYKDRNKPEGHYQMEQLITSTDKVPEVTVEKIDAMALQHSDHITNKKIQPAIPYLGHSTPCINTYKTAKEKRFRYNLVSIPRGRVYKIRLSDGTDVWLNADSKFSFPTHFTGNSRTVTLEGEAYFKVSPNKFKPFIIKTDKVYTQVLGTELNIKAYKDSETHITLVKGEVSVQIQNLSQGITLSPSENLSCSSESYEVKKVDTGYYSQWMEGYFYFDDVSLTDILRDLGRWYNLTIEMEQNPRLLNLRLHFIASRNDNIDHVLDNLNTYNFLSATKVDNKVIIKWK